METGREIHQKGEKREKMEWMRGEEREDRDMTAVKRRRIMTKG